MKRLLLPLIIPTALPFTPSPTFRRTIPLYRPSCPLSMAVEPTEVFMPALSSTMSEGKIVSWLKDEGDEVTAGDVLMVVESDKADMDVEAFEDGYLAKIVIGEGETADVGAVVGLIVESEADIAAAASAGPAAPVAAAVEEEEAAAPAGGAAPDCEFSQIDMPALSSTMKEGKVVSWLKAEGDAITAGEAIMVVESDKADMDVEAFEDGYLAAIITEEGESGAVGAPVALIAAEEGDIPALKAYAGTLSGAPPAPVAAAPAPAAATPAASLPKATPAAAAAATGGRVVASPLAKKMAAEMGVDLSTVAGTGPNGRITGDDVKAAAAGGGSAKPAAPAAPEKPKHVPGPGVVAATPMARVLAKKAKLDISTLVGTGEFGRVTAKDVRIATGEEKEVRKTTKKGVEEVELPDGLEPFTAMQRGVSKNMEATLSTPVFRCSRDIQMDEFNSFYQKMKPKGVSVSSLLAKAVALAVEKHPIINSGYHPDGGIIWKKDINVAMAVAIDGGLITPTLKYANEKDILELGQDWRTLVEKAKSNSLTPDEYTTGTVTISNLGMFGVNQFDAILPKGTGSILAIGATREVVVPDKQAVLGLKVINQMTVTLTCDHRQIYGADGAMFMQTLAKIMEDPVANLL